MKLKKAETIKGTIELPGDKSISHRAAMFSAIAEGEAKIENFSGGEDCFSTIKVLRDLGVEINIENSMLFIKGVGKKGFKKPQKNLDCGNSGTTMRLMAGVLAGQDFDSVLVGDESLSKRPMRRIIEPLAQMNAEILTENNRPPLKIRGNNLSAADYELPIASAQVKSCVLLAGLHADGITKVINPETSEKISVSRNHTELLLKYLGAEIEEEFIATETGFRQEISTNSKSKLTAKDIYVPGDISSAAFFIAAALCLKDSELIIKNVGLNKTRTGFLDLLIDFGFNIEIKHQKEVSGETIGDLLIKGNNDFTPRGNNVINGDVIANLIDEIPILAVLATQIEGGLEIRDAGELRVKETDRIAAVAENLRRMNTRIEEFPDGLRIEKSKLKA
ncbi:MAG TPA: 3-phosphoshikimate 1-carboxyvinyltransferase, partial [Pyrinomonadaceae bacterium]|nr:3-phosphoshikimate 1-carboxyvinyltransferase [Pyrinomonadaceae bacterium]